MVSHGGRSGAGENRCLSPELSLQSVKKASGPKAPKVFTLEKSTPLAAEGQDRQPDGRGGNAALVS